MLRFAGVRDDVVYDLGCGDGRIVIAAAKQCGARRRRGRHRPRPHHRVPRERTQGPRGRAVQFHCKSFFDTDFSDATVLMLYLLPAINVKLRPHPERAPSPARASWPTTSAWANGSRTCAPRPTIACCTSGRPRTGRRDVAVRDQSCAPAGGWALRLRGRYQVVTGTARVGRQDVPVTNGMLFGDALTFKVRDPEDRAFRPYAASTGGSSAARATSTAGRRAHRVGCRARVMPCRSRLSGPRPSARYAAGRKRLGLLPHTFEM